MSGPDDESFEPTTLLTREQLAAALQVHDDLADYLVVGVGSGRGQRVEIGAEAVTIGRDSQKVLSFNDADLSRFHLQVWRTADAVMVQDMGSTNGTFVNDERVVGPRPLREGDAVRAGRQLFTYERRRRSEVAQAVQLQHDLQVARSYVLALLPEPTASGPVHVSWHFVPSMHLGGDAFGYGWIDDTTFVFYLMDVSGHGAGAAMHSVTVLNLLRQRALPDVDLRQPAEVLAALNARFPMEQHGGMFFTMWYGVYRAGDRSLTFSCAGHHPAYLVPADRDALRPLATEALMIGAMDDAIYTAQRATIPPGSSLYLFSDGAFEVDTHDGRMWGLKDFLPFLVQPVEPGTTEPERLYRTVKAASSRDPLADDFSLLTLTFW